MSGRAPRSVETRWYGERAAFFAGLARVSRRGFVKLAAASAGLVAAKGLRPPHGYQLVDVAGAAEPSQRFTFAYISDTHLYPSA